MALSGAPGDFLRVKLTGADEAAKTLRGLADGMGKKILDKVTRNEVKKWAEAARQKAPLGTKAHKVGRKNKELVQAGNLRRNIKVKKLRIERYFKATDSHFGIFIPRIAFYWMFYEFGAKNVTRRSFLRPAFDENANQSLVTMASEAKNFIRIYLEKKSRANISRRTVSKMFGQA